MPKLTPVNLTMLMDEGVLMAANERFFWPFGLALTWTYDKENGMATGLHIREWDYTDGHMESIGLAVDDEVAAERRQRFKAWAEARIDELPVEERARAHDVARPVLTPVVDG